MKTWDLMKPPSLKYSKLKFSILQPRVGSPSMRRTGTNFRAFSVKDLKVQLICGTWKSKLKVSVSCLHPQTSLLFPPLTSALEFQLPLKVSRLSQHGQAWRRKSSTNLARESKARWSAPDDPGQPPHLKREAQRGSSPWTRGNTSPMSLEVRASSREETRWTSRASTRGKRW